MRYKAIPQHILEFLRVGERAIKTAFDSLGYCRRVSKKKGFSDNLEVKEERVAFVEEGLTWTRERIENQIFSDEVWAMGGPFTTSYVTVKKDGSDCYLPENLQHKYSKRPAWMFHGFIFKGRKGIGIFWEKEWGNINSASYNIYVLLKV